MANDRKKRNLEVLKNAVDKDRQGGGAPGSGGGGSNNQIMYRGKPVGRSGGGGAPGSPGSSGGRTRPTPQPNEGGDVKEALRKLTQLFNDGLITTAEYEAKRAEILNRL